LKRDSVEDSGSIRQASSPRLMPKNPWSPNMDLLLSNYLPALMLLHNGTCQQDDQPPSGNLTSDDDMESVGARRSCRRYNHRLAP
jgi:hypothetical protein